MGTTDMQLLRSSFAAGCGSVISLGGNYYYHKVGLSECDPWSELRAFREEWNEMEKDFGAIRRQIMRTMRSDVYGNISK